MRGHTLPDKSEEIADEKSSAVAPGGYVDSIKLNEGTPVDS